MKMRLVSAIFAGVMVASAFGGATAYAQESSSEIWVNTQWNTPWNRAPRAEAALRNSLSRIHRPAEEVALGFTLTSYAGVVGQLELGRISLGPDMDAENFLTFIYPGLASNSVDEAVGQASISWNVTPRVALSTSFSRDMADAISSDGVPVFEDTFGGGVSLAVTPRFEISASGSRSSVSIDEFSPGTANFNSEEAGFGAAYSFMPFLSGSVNYTYRSYDGQVGEFRADESTLSLSVTGTF